MEQERDGNFCFHSQFVYMYCGYTSIYTHLNIGSQSGNMHDKPFFPEVC